MKLLTIAILILGLLSSSTLAVAESLVPFSAYEQMAGTPSSAPPLPDAGNDPAATTAQSAHSGQMTTGGKVITGVGIALVGIGAVLIGFGASVNSNQLAGSKIKPVGLGAGAGFAGVGVVMIVVGLHKHKAK
jgi:hypothetical protein